ncbi:MAG: DUF2846 domain-containing protein [Gammaproteobacteria bacterium]|nr:MAG: DUF2846 domain-containing protein [Gammaproteobacteria bacterium]
MLKKITGLCFITAFVLLTGCASGPSYQTFQKTLKPLSADQGRIYFTRLDTMFGAAVTSDIKLNDEVVGASVSGGFFFIDREPGSYIVSTSTEVERNLQFVLEANQTAYIETEVGMGLMVGRIYPKLIPEIQAMKQIKENKFDNGLKN